MVWPMVVTTILTLHSLAGTAAGEVQTVRTVVHQPIGTSQSQEDTRAVAVARARRQTLEEAVPLLGRLSVIRDANLTDEEVLALASGALVLGWMDRMTGTGRIDRNTYFTAGNAPSTPKIPTSGNQFGKPL